MQSGSLTFPILFAAVIALLALIGLRQRKEADAKLTKALIDSFGTNPDEPGYALKGMTAERYAQVPAYYLHHPAPFQIDDITWNDLEMDQIYQRINQCMCAAGEEYLYYLLRTPAGRSADLAYTEKQLSFASEEADSRLKLQKLLHGISTPGKYSLYQYLDLLDALPEQSALIHIVLDVLLILSFIVMITAGGFGVLFFIAMLAVNVVTYFRQKAAVEPYLVSFSYLLRMVRAAGPVSEVPVQAFSDELSRLSQLHRSFGGFTRGAWLLVRSGEGSGNPLDILLDYVRIVFHLDLIKYARMLREVKNRGRDFDEMVTILGRLDAAISIASFRSSLKNGFCIPETAEYAEGKAPMRFEADGLYHPLIPEPVKNSIRADRCVLLTGSNASGKSTFLKASALAVLLGETIGTVCAGSCRFTFFRVCSSMALRDNLQGSESYFIVEIKSLKRILDASGEENAAPVLAFVDEVLRGTNTVERISAGAGVLRGFSENGILCFAATHDLELTELLADCYDNYHFREEVRGEDIFFPYLLMPGKATTRYAILLLKTIGYDDGIVNRAAERAAGFIETGKWSTIDAEK